MKSNRLLALIALAALPVSAEAAVNEFILSSNLHRFIVSRSGTAGETEMGAYTKIIPGTNVTFRMVPIPGGDFLMGSPASEPKRKPDEGPQHRVRIEPFWMSACEVTWDEYDVFMNRIRVRSMTPAERARQRNLETNALADAVALPSHPYIDNTMGMGRQGFPAVNMTQHAANKYCQWLSALTGNFYRLPTEAEWEYACRAGTTTRYSFGDDEKGIEEYAWFDLNSSYKYQKVGRKKPNPWGLYDMHGNVAEWTLDGYDKETYARIPDGTLAPYVRATRPYPHSVRGGSWDDGPARLRSASRQYSEPRWKAADPCLPKSVWHMVEAYFVGFRIVRPLKIPSAEEMHRAWNNGVELE
jgi:formylglycine-generating enzyme required for sulfatase activity